MIVHTLNPYSEPKLLPKNYVHPDEQIFLELKPAKFNYFMVPIVLVIFSFYKPILFYFSIPVLLFAIAAYMNTSYAITNKRVIFIKGIINKYYVEAPLNKIQDVNMRIPFLSGNTGSVAFDTAGTSFKEIIWINIYNPRDVFNKVSSILNK